MSSADHAVWDLQDTIDCWFKTDAKSVWNKCPTLPEWLGSALGALDVPWAPSAWQELPALPAHLRCINKLYFLPMEHVPTHKEQCAAAHLEDCRHWPVTHAAVLRLCSLIVWYAQDDCRKEQCAAAHLADCRHWPVKHAAVLWLSSLIVWYAQDDSRKEQCSVAHLEDCRHWPVTHAALVDVEDGCSCCE